MKKTLIIIDMQEDFVRGALANPAAEAIIPNIRAKMDEYLEREDSILFTMDTHYKNYLEFQEGKLLPVPHCIRDTKGWNIVPELELPKAIHIKKTTFGFTGWQWEGKNLGIDGENANCTGAGIELELVGTCTDICVVSNALILKATYPEAKITIDASCCAGLTPEKHKAALETMKSCQINVINE